MQTKNPNRYTEADLYVSRESNPEWITGAERTPHAGEQVYCVEGAAIVAKVLGKTGDGSRLLELKLETDEKAKPFFAAASNVLVPPERAA
ncbi:MAG: hypothetical protein M3483_00805 [Gemmatimonadota bacterium]|nr:hypothetical protein [Gemmatimonadota bacterium]